jgi:DASH complex subunit SPC19
MYRPSYAPSSGRPRESVFTSGPLPRDNQPICSPYIEACVAAAQESCDKVSNFFAVDAADVDTH